MASTRPVGNEGFGFFEEDITNRSAGFCIRMENALFVQFVSRNTLMLAYGLGYSTMPSSSPFHLRTAIPNMLGSVF
jgi:hypothetical protein